MLRGAGFRRESVAYLLTGIGTGALLDGFVPHQLLQWHHLVSLRVSGATVSGLQENTFFDGIFHAFALLVLLGGVALMVGRSIQLRPLIALALVGWGGFNIADHLIFHLALEAHHIREDVTDPAIYDWAFFALGVVLMATGRAVSRTTAGSQVR